MNTILLVATALFVGCFAASSQHDFTALFSQFKKQFNRKYKTAEEEQFRYNAFVNNMKEAARLQAENPFAEFGMNNFADFTREEFKPYHNLGERKTQAPNNCTTKRTPKANPPKSYDWREHGAVTDVKNQGQCGSCWAFSATANIEGQWALAGHNLTSLSEQEIVSCDTTSGGCNGGYPDWAYEWLLTAREGKLDTLASYPYTSGNGVTGKCEPKKGVEGAQFQDCEMIETNEKAMQAWTASFGPISICLDASSFMSYTKGVLTKCPGTQIDHCVLIAGYNDAVNPPYWIVKNSWGASWGEQGYIYIEMFKNNCDLTDIPTSVVVKKA